MNGNPISRLFIGLTIGIAGSLAGCAGGDGGRYKTDRVVISEQESVIVFYEPETASMRSTFYKGASTGHEFAYYVAVWTTPDAVFPHARIEVIDPGPNMHISVALDPAKYINDLDFGADFPITVQGAGWTKNALGRIKYQRFRAGDVDCLAFVETWGQSSTDTYSAGTDQLVGHYCLAPNARLTDSRIEAILSGIGVKGEGVPQPSEAWRRAREDNQPEGLVEVPFVLSWEGLGDGLEGKFMTTGTPWSGRFWLPLQAGSTECAGTWEQKYKNHADGSSEGIWRVLCTNGRSGSGTYGTSGPLKGSGSGTDTQGRRIEFTFGK